MRSSKPHLLVAVALGTLVVMAACHARPRPLEPDRSRGTLITAEEIEVSGAKTVWDALQMHVKYAMFDESGSGTPRGIQRRGSSSILFNDQMLIVVDDVRIIDVRILSEMPARLIERILVLNGVEATTFYGTNAGDGAIVISTKGS